MNFRPKRKEKYFYILLELFQNQPNRTKQHASTLRNTILVTI